MKEELKNVKEEIKYLKEKETVENPKSKPEAKFSCKLCYISFKSKEELKMHHKSNHTARVKCESCVKTFEFISQFKSLSVTIG